MNIRIEILKPTHMAYMRRVGPYGDGNMMLMANLKAWAGQKNLLQGQSLIYGIARDNPITTPADKCRYDVGLLVDDVLDDSEVTVTQSPGGKYAIITIDHTGQAIENIYNNLNTIVKDHKLSYDPDRLLLERYDSVLVSQHLCEICLPIK